MTTILATGSPAYADQLLEQALGKPWACLGRGPDSYDCWGLVLHILRNGLGWADAPDFLYATGLEERERAFAEGMTQELATGLWQPLAKPEPYCVIMLGQTRRITHVGIWHPSNTIFHCFEGAGVIGTKIPTMKKLGWSRMLPYKHKDMTWLT